MKSPTYSVRLPFILAPSERPEALMAALVRDHPGIFHLPRPRFFYSEEDTHAWLNETAARHGFDGWVVAFRFDGPVEWTDVSFYKNP